jgi:DNA-binding MarR family transcriptional regulator
VNSESHGSGRAGDDAGARAEAIRQLERELSLLFRRSRSLSTRMAGQIHPELDIPAYGLLLAMLDLDPDGAGVRAADLVERTKLHKSTLSRTIGDLERLGLVTRVRDPEDARARLVTLTDSGRTAVRESRSGRHEVMRQRLQHWDAEDLTVLADLLGRFSRALGDDT